MYYRFPELTLTYWTLEEVMFLMAQQSKTPVMTVPPAGGGIKLWTLVIAKVNRTLFSFFEHATFIKSHHCIFDHVLSSNHISAKFVIEVT